jgi:hypothetical protein
MESLVEGCDIILGNEVEKLMSGDKSGRVSL